MTGLNKELEAIIHLGDIAAVKALVARGANLNAQDEDGETIFARAVFLNRDRDYIHELLELGAKADAPSCEGGTPLTLAVMNNDFLLVQMLLEAGANPNVIAYKTEEPQAALDIAYNDYIVVESKSEEMNLDAIVQLLKEHGAKSRSESTP